eukprot:Lankesteria_metandrocarpae@DN9514_c0_g1_i1.p1
MKLLKLLCCSFLLYCTKRTCAVTDSVFVVNKQYLIADSWRRVLSSMTQIGAAEELRYINASGVNSGTAKWHKGSAFSKSIKDTYPALAIEFEAACMILQSPIKKQLETENVDFNTGEVDTPDGSVERDVVSPILDRDGTSRFVSDRIVATASASSDLSEFGDDYHTEEYMYFSVRDHGHGYKKFLGYFKDLNDISVVVTEYGIFVLLSVTSL